MKVVVLNILTPYEFEVTIIAERGFTKYFYNIKLTAQEYVCNMAVCTAEEFEDVWFIANNISESYAIRE